jgi:predicted nucleic acid-binding protein
MKVIKSLSDLSKFVEINNLTSGALADTGFLYATAYYDDRLFEQANAVLDILSDEAIPIYTNVVSRMEFVDLIFRKQVTEGCIQLFESLPRASAVTPVYNLLKNIRDKDAASRKQNQSYKIDERRLKQIRSNIEGFFGFTDWKAFCEKYIGSMLLTEWKLIEEEFGFNFVEVMEGATSELVSEPLRWDDMVAIMGEQGMRGPDAMIVNLLDKSKFQLLITSDSDFENCLDESLRTGPPKAIFLLQ